MPFIYLSILWFFQVLPLNSSRLKAHIAEGQIQLRLQLSRVPPKSRISKGEVGLGMQLLEGS